MSVLPHDGIHPGSVADYIVYSTALGVSRTLVQGRFLLLLGAVRVSEHPNVPASRMRDSLEAMQAEGASRNDTAGVSPRANFPDSSRAEPGSGRGGAQVTLATGAPAADTDLLLPVHRTIRALVRCAARAGA